MKIGKLFFDKNIIITAFIYFFISGFFLYKFGITLNGEAVKFIDDANRILLHQELRTGFFGIFYFVYSLIVSFFIKFSINLIFVAILQIVLSFIAALSFYFLLLNTLQNKTISFLFFCAYLLCYPIQKWNYFLYSESVHTSFVVIAIYLFHKAIIEKRYSWWLIFGLITMAVLFSRPVGIIFLFSAVFIFIKWLYGNNKKMLAYVVSFVSIGALIGIFNSPVTTFINPDSLKRMEIICQVPEANAHIRYREFNSDGLYKVYAVIKNDIGFSNFFVKGFKKLGYFFGMQRSYYSWQNNVFLMLYLIFYPFALIGIFSKQPQTFLYIKLLAILYLLLTSMAIFVTCDDWSNRFISPAFPFILILAAAGVFSVFEKFRKPIQK